jgi:phospholipid transport system substrate-binding protein
MRATSVCGIMTMVVLVGLPTRLLAETPIQALQQTIDRVQTLVHDPGLKEESSTEQVLGTILARFDVQEMSKRILGPYWDQPRDQQDAFVVAFTAFMKRMFVGHFDQITSLHVTCRGEEIRGAMAQVLATLSTAGQAVTVNFRMHQQGSEWKIYDVVMDHGRVSLVSSYRTQLQWILQSSSFEQLLRIIREKNP